MFAGRWMEAFKQKNMEDGVNEFPISLTLSIEISRKAEMLRL